MDTVSRKTLLILAGIIQNALSHREGNGVKQKYEIKQKYSLEENGGKGKYEIKRKYSLDGLITLLTEDLPREEANNLLRNKRKEIIPVAIRNKYEKYRKDELFHIAHVRQCMDLLLPEKAPCQHDHTKDELYFFVSICAYDLKHPISQDKVNEYHEQHWTKEPHHPEYEKIKGNIIHDTDIIETVVDRLSRNLQFNRGKYNQGQLKKYEPQYLRNNAHRLTLYKAYQDGLSPMVRETWQKMKTGKMKKGKKSASI